MKVRESGMPDLELWETFFDPINILKTLGLQNKNEHVVEFGCGYGTFTIPAAQMIQGKVTGLEIDGEMIARTKQRAKMHSLSNVEIISVDFEKDKTPLPDNCADYAMLFNILHGEHPQALLYEAFRLLEPGSQGSLIHWNFDPDTPRGPPMEIRPQPDALRQIALDVGFTTSAEIDLPPYHFGFALEKPNL